MKFKKLKELWNHNKRGFAIIHEISPAYMPLAALKAVIAAVQPLIVLYLSASILNELSGDRDLGRILTYVGLTVGLSFLLSVANAQVFYKIGIAESTFQERFYFFLGKRYMQLDFEHVEKGSTNEKLADIEAKNNGNGLGITNLYYHFPGFVESLAGLIASGVLLAGMLNVSKAYTSSFITSPYAAMLIWALLPLSMLVTFYFRSKEVKILAKVFEDNPKTNSFFHYYYEYVKAENAGKDIRIYNQLPAIREIMKIWSDKTSWYRYFRFEGGMKGTTGAVNAFVGGVVYLLIGLRALAGMYGPGSAIQYIGAVTGFINHFTSLCTMLGIFYINTPFLELLYSYLDLSDEKYRGTLTTEKRTDSNFDIEFHNVSFKYPESDTWAVRNLDLKIQVGQRLAVVGMNGSGKTTMIKLLCRLYDPTEGEITLNGINIRKYDYEEYMRLFSVVFQDFKLFSLPLSQNVGASTGVDRDKAEKCLVEAGFGERLKTMPKGIESSLNKNFDEEGVKVSGGEAQKIALARALYKNAPFIVLDEPTAALDPISEFEVYTKFNEYINGKTAVYISHRLSSCKFCHDIAVFHEGRLIQRGGHDELLADREGKYRELWNAQAQYYEDEKIRVEAV